MSTVGKPIKCRGAVTWSANVPFTIENIEVAVPKKGEVRIKLLSSGLCRSDFQVLQGIDKSLAFPSLLGHEGAGVIESVGEGVTRLQPGDIVVGSCKTYCRECDFCENPNTNMCRTQPENHTIIGESPRITCKGKTLSQMLCLGTFAEYTVTSQHSVAKVNPKANPLSLCLAGCCLLTGYGAAINNAKVKPGSTCAVFGLGGVGMCVVMGCRDSGASKIIGIDVNPQKYELGKQFGLTDFVNPREVTSVPEAIKKLTGEGADYCFASVGILSVMEQAFDSSHPFWGKTVIIGETEEGTKVKAGVWDVIMGRELCGSVLGGYKPVRDIPHLVDKAVSGQIQLDKLVTHALPLTEINEGYELLNNGKALRVVIDFSLTA